MWAWMVVHPFMSEALAYGKKIWTEKKKKKLSQLY